ncbi:MAG: hypothetical protein HY079_04040 [Elusimicrobia bacterium]|nr:hypothetical protein [Elusimicrobiota bacterium]
MSAPALSPKTSRTLCLIGGAMGLGVAALAAVIAVLHLRCARTPTPDEVRLINLMTGAAMVAALLAIVASEVVWKAQLKGADAANADARVTTAFIVRTALREGSAMFGLVVGLLAALNGTLGVYPAYWVALAPAALFLGYLAMHWPSPENLQAELDAALPR